MGKDIHNSFTIAYSLSVEQRLPVRMSERAEFGTAVTCHQSCVTVPLCHGVSVAVRSSVSRRHREMTGSFGRYPSRVRIMTSGSERARG